MTITEASHIATLIRAILGDESRGAGDVAESMVWLSERAGKVLQLSLRVDEEAARTAAERIEPDAIERLRAKAVALRVRAERKLIAPLLMKRLDKVHAELVEASAPENLEGGLCAECARGYHVNHETVWGLPVPDGEPVNGAGACRKCSCEWRA